jgi:hypothetical protein
VDQAGRLLLIVTAGLAADGRVLFVPLAGEKEEDR